jgi:hypothetical protein
MFILFMMTGGWGKLRNFEFHNLYSSPSIIRMIKSGRMRWARHIYDIGGKARRKNAAGKTNT